MKRLVPIILILILISTSVYADNFQDGLEAYERNDYKVAFEKLKPLAEQGNATAQNKLGWMYNKGQGVTQDYAEAFKWYRLSAERGHAKSQANLGWMYINGEGIKKDYDEAIKWFRLSAEQGNASAQASIGVMYEKGWGVKMDYAEAIKWARKSVEQGVYPQNFLGFMYLKGHGVSQDYREALKWFKLSAEQGNATAQTNVGLMYLNGYGVVPNPFFAIDWFKLSAEQGNATAKEKLLELNKLYGNKKELEDELKPPSTNILPPRNAFKNTDHSTGGCSYQIEANSNDDFFVINGEKFEAQTYCFGFEEGDMVRFLEGSPLGACATAEILNCSNNNTCDLWCK